MWCRAAVDGKKTTFLVGMIAFRVRVALLLPSLLICTICVSILYFSAKRFVVCMCGEMDV